MGARRRVYACVRIRTPVYIRDPTPLKNLTPTYKKDPPVKKNGPRRSQSSSNPRKSLKSSQKEQCFVNLVSNCVGQVLDLTVLRQNMAVGIKVLAQVFDLFQAT